MKSLVLLISILACLPTARLNPNQPTQELITQGSDRLHSNCRQPAAEQEAHIREAVDNQYMVRRVEFFGNAHTRDNVLRRKIMLEEGDVFTRENLLKSLESVSKLRKIIYPVKLSDVEIRLARSYKIIDLTICFCERRKSPEQKCDSLKPAG